MIYPYFKKLGTAEIYMASRSLTNGTQLLISPKPFITITEKSNALLLSVMDFQNKEIHVARYLFGDKAPKSPASVRGAVRILTKEFAIQLKILKINHLIFTTVDASDPITDVIRLSLKTFVKNGIKINDSK